MPFGPDCSYEAVLELAKQSEMLFRAPEKFLREGNFSLYVCRYLGWKVIRVWWRSAGPLCFLDFLLYVLLLGQTCCCHIYGLCVLSLPASFFLFSSFVITAKPEPFVTLCHFEPLLFSRHTHPHLFHTHTCHTHCIVLLAVLICIGTGEKINKGNTEKSTVSGTVPEVSERTLH